MNHLRKKWKKLNCNTKVLIFRKLLKQDENDIEDLKNSFQLLNQKPTNEPEVQTESIINLNFR